jgi:hypothetical protein
VEGEEGRERVIEGWLLKCILCHETHYFVQLISAYKM